LRSLTVLPPAPEGEIPVWEGTDAELEEKVAELSRGRQWEEIIGGFSHPRKMPGIAYGYPASTCKTGSKLAEKPGTVCNSCYARKGTFRFGNVQKALWKRYHSLFDPLWTPAIVAGVRSEARPGDHVRLNDSGDFQSLNHLKNIFTLCRSVRDVLFWGPTREPGLLKLIKPEDVPDNLTIRLSGNLLNGKPPKGWPWTSTVVSEDGTCPTSQEGGSCADFGCFACWSRDVANVEYELH